MKKFLFLTLTLQVILFAQDSKDISLVGVLSLDRSISFSETSSSSDSLTSDLPSRKSPLFSGFLSFAVPGAGQLYNGDLVKAGIFFIIDAAALTTAVIYNNKGNDQTAYFEGFANAHWSVERYATWTVNNAVRINPALEGRESSLFQVFNSDGTVNWNKLNQLENAVGNYYSHQLAGYGEQQYYEMIGKYTQFNVGWDDFTEDPNDPFTYTHERKDPLTEKFVNYSSQRGEANDFYNVASKAVLVMVVNHIISAAEAAWSTSRYNKTLNMNVSLNKKSFGFVTDYYPQLNVCINF